MVRAQSFFKPACVLLLFIFATTWILVPQSLKTKYEKSGRFDITYGPRIFLKPDIALLSISGQYGNLINLSLADINSNFFPNTLDTCENDCKCSDTLNDTRTRDDWARAFERRSIKGRSLFNSNEFVFPWEADYLSKPPLKHIKDLPDLKLSKVWFLPSEGRPISQGSVVGKKYERLSFRVDLVDGYGINRRLGGDEIRVWISVDITVESEPEQLQFSATGYVEDLRNGSYVVTVTPLWTGLTNLNIGVVYPREYIRAALHHARIGSNRFIYGLFTHMNLDLEEYRENDTSVVTHPCTDHEQSCLTLQLHYPLHHRRLDGDNLVTVCHTTPNIPGRYCICNYTSINKVPFYCGRPLDKRLKCEDWSSIWPAVHPPFTDLTHAENYMALRMARPARDALIKHGLVIEAIENDEDHSLPPCTRTSRTASWDKESPRGFWSKGPTWTSLICDEPEMTSQWVQKCLRSSQVWLIGDSNVIRMARELCSLLECQEQPPKSNWQNSFFTRIEEHNITIIFKPHEQPLYLCRQWMPLYLNGGIPKYLSSVPSTGKHVVIIHYFLHLASSHLSALHYRLVALREALQDLLKRNPRVIVGIRGPHISTVQWAYNHLLGGDVLGAFMVQMFYDIFKDLRKRVILLDGWDMSISISNEEFHPHDSVPKAMLRTLLSFKCS